MVGKYERKENTEKSGTLTHFKGKKAVATPEGYIFIDKKFSFKKFCSFLNFKWS